MPSVAAIIPAYNEERTIGGVVRAVRRCPAVRQIVVVSDGCTDETALEAHRAGADVLALHENVGKGGAIAAGLRQVDADVIVLLDGDLIGLTPNHVWDLLDPVLRGDSDMTIGQHVPDLVQELFPNTSGQRAVRREILEEIRDLAETGFGVEAALTRFLRDTGTRAHRVVLENLSHVKKTEKHGLMRSLPAKVRAMWETVKWTGRATGRT